MHQVAFTHWSASWLALLCYAAVAGAHLAGLARLRAVGGAAERRLGRQAVVFQGGLLIALLALVSPIGYWSGIYIWPRELQFLLLAVVSTGLMVLGAPRLVLRAAWTGRGPGRPRTGAPDQLRTHPVPGKKSRGGHDRWLIARPAVAVVAVNVVWLGWQLPVAFDAAKTSSAVALAAHASCLAAGLVLWLHVIGSRPVSLALPPLRRLRLLIGTVATVTAAGMLLAFGSRLVYPAYAGGPHHVMTALDDQQLAGAVLWLGMLPALMTAVVALVLRWLADEDSAELSAGLDRLLLTPRKDAWSARPGIR